MAEKLTLGIIGMGGIGTIHAEAHQAVGETEIAAICDVDKKKLTKAGKKFGVKQRFDDYRDLLKTDVEAVAVCVGNALHKEVALAAIDAGKHVFLEKPMAMNAAEAAEIAAAADKADPILQMGMVWRFNPAAQIIRQWVEDGQFGEIYHMRSVLVRRRGVPGLGGWFTTKAEAGGGALIDIGVHWFDLPMYLSGLWNPTAISAKTYAEFGLRMRDYTYVGMWAGPPNFDGVFDVEDYATGFVRFGRQATLSFEIAWAANSEDASFVEILGDKAGVRAFDGKPLKLLTEHRGKLSDIEPKFDAKANSFELQARSLVGACRGEHEPLATAQQGLTVMKLIGAIYASSDAGAEVKIES